MTRKSLITDLTTVALLAVLVASLGCSSNNSTTTVASPGTVWEASLLETTGAPSPYDFVVDLSIGTDGSLSITSITFITNDPCFVSGAGVTGQASLTVDSTTDAVTGTMNLSVQSGTPSGNSLQLTGTTVTGTESSGTLSGGKVTGDWALTGSSGCSAGGTFTLSQQ